MENKCAITAIIQSPDKDFPIPCAFRFFCSVDNHQYMLHYCATMKTATVRDLRNRYTSVLRWVSAGEDVLITRRGKVIARLTPETAQTAQNVDWASSPEVLRDRCGFSLYGNDVHSPLAVAWVARSKTPLFFNDLVHFEFGNALRFAEFRKVIPPGSAARYGAGFEAAIAQGRLIVKTTNFADVIDEAKRLSAIHTLSVGHRAFDILHVASALTMKATHFLTFDENQKKLAEAENLIVPL
jgi:prevent-host-death family protein